MRACTETTVPLNAEYRRAARDVRSSTWDQVAQFAASSECRMRRLVAHFGDSDEAALTCGRCDVCRPATIGIAQDSEALPSTRDFDLRLLRSLATKDEQAAGRIYREVFEPGGRRALTV